MTGEKVVVAYAKRKQSPAIILRKLRKIVKKLAGIIFPLLRFDLG
jgi:hypothetical protein